jgi:hypothetical protein
VVLRPHKKKNKAVLGTVILIKFSERRVALIGEADPTLRRKIRPLLPVYFLL